MRWWSQPFAAEGSSTSEGIKNLLGRPDLDPLVVLVREAAQNSWDARRGDFVDFSIDVRRLGARAGAWQHLLLPEPDLLTGMRLAENLAPDSMVVRVSDRGTTGLGGPIRADLPLSPGTSPDFVSFIRNVGEPRDTALGGGTFGFGKGIFYGLSRSSTLIVRTRCLVEGAPQVRLMGAALGHSFDGATHRYTGRHWWGDVVDNVPDPLLDERAEQVAVELGLEPFEDDFGTDVLVLGADLGLIGEDDELRPRTPNEAAEMLASAILWHLWPKCTTRGTRHGMSFAVRTDEMALELPEPSTIAELLPFVQALHALDSDDSCEAFVTGPTTVGHYARADTIAPLRPTRTWLPLAAPFEGRAHHCALMRQAELVVKYVEGPVPIEEMLQYGAVFRASADADEHFAKSEPPTHDDWISRGLEPVARRIVHGTLVRVGKKLAALAPLGEGADADHSAALGALSGRLAPLIPTIGGGGAASHQRRPGREGSQPRLRPRARLVDEPAFRLTPSGPRIVATVEVDPWAQALDVTLVAQVLVEGGSPEGDAPDGGSRPEVLGWGLESSAEMELSTYGPLLRLPADAPRRWTVLVRPAADAVTGLAVTADERSEDS